ILRPYAIALAAGWEQAYGYPLEVFANDDCVLVQLPKEVPARELLDLVTPENVEPLLRSRLERTGYFGTRFRENAARALLLPRRRGGTRTPLWLNRLRAQKLLEAVRRYDDFPVLAETWRTCLEDEFDLDGLRARLEEVSSGVIEVSETTTTHPSPFAGGITWRSTERYVYDRNERPGAAGAPSLSDEALREVLHDAALRPRLDPALAKGFASKLQRTASGYEPRDAAEWLDHAEEQVLVAPREEVPPGLEVVLDGLDRAAAAARARAKWRRPRAGGMRRPVPAEPRPRHARLSPRLLRGPGGAHGGSARTPRRGRPPARRPLLEDGDRDRVLRRGEPGAPPAAHARGGAPGPRRVARGGAARFPRGATGPRAARRDER
ncbi:MAG: hypothetical protein ACYS0K_19060, partial [Planctomycetota bacterium]